MKLTCLYTLLSLLSPLLTITSSLATTMLPLRRVFSATALRSLKLHSASSMNAVTFRGGASRSRLYTTPPHTFPTWSFADPCLSMTLTDRQKVQISITDSNSASFTAPSKDESSTVTVFAFVESDNSDSTADLTTSVFKSSPHAKLYDDKFNSVLTATLKSQQSDAKGFKHTSIVTIMDQQQQIRRATLFNLGKNPPAKLSPSKSIIQINARAAKLGAYIAALSSSSKASTIKISLPSDFIPSVDGINVKESEVLKSFSNELLNSMYTDNRYKTCSNKVKNSNSHVNLNGVQLTFDKPLEGVGGEAEKSLKHSASICAGVALAKDIVNSPPNILNSLSLADCARTIASSSSQMSIKVLSAKECEALGMGAYLAVARGAETPPQFIHLTYTPEGKVTKKLALVGKGLTFDSGGLNIKTQMMELMKFDCGGSAGVLGAAKAISEIQPEGVEVHFIVAACENSINERAMRPGDVLTASNGVTIEVLNTDAEGRLTLADALVYADKTVGAEKIIDMATLTGACMTALGAEIAGLWSPDDEFAELLNSCGTSTSDRVWRMPLANNLYEKHTVSKIADIKNTGHKYGGAITAALFLEKFVDKSKPWAHLDIAGPVWNDKNGANGFGVKLLVEFVEREARNCGV